MARFSKWHYIFYYNGSELYFLDFTYVLARPPGIAFVNGSWYLDITTYIYSGIDSTVYRLNLRNFSVVQVNTGWFELLRKNRIKLNGRRIVVPQEFQSADSSAPTADVVVANLQKNTKLYGGRVVLANSSEFPVYKILLHEREPQNLWICVHNSSYNSSSPIEEASELTIICLFFDLLSISLP